jgi:anti-sigma B factor antagonist
VLFEVVASPAPGVSEVTVLAVTGEIDVASAPRLRQEVVTLAGSGQVLLVVDLAGVDFLDSTGLGVLLGALKRVRAGGGELALCRAEPQVAKVFEITRLSDILPLHDSVAAAVAAVVEG